MLPRSELADSPAPCITAAAPLLLNYWVIFNLEKLQPEIGILYPQRRAGGRMWGRHCGGLGMRLAAPAGPFPGARAPRSTVPAGLRRGCAARPLLARHGWSFSLDSHGEGTEQLQTHKQILLQQAIGREPCSACQAACVTACRQVAADGDWVPPSKSILQRCSRVMECAVEEQPGGLLFCPREEALLDHTALPNSMCRESCRGGARERSVTLAPWFSFTPPLALPLQCFAGSSVVSACLPCLELPE